MRRERRRRAMPIPVNIITGALGVGKTTTIRHLISKRPPGERWAIVVNEFGALGIDGAVLDTAGGVGASTSGGGGGGGGEGADGGVTVREVAGGCMCCALSAPFTVAVTQILRRVKPDRLLIEPSGLGHPGGLFDALSGEHLGKALDLRATVALVDMTEVAQRGELFMCETFNDQVNCADVVVGAKADVATDADQEAFRRWATTELYPPRAHVTTIAHGALPLEVLDQECIVPILCVPILGNEEEQHEHEHEHEEEEEEEAKEQSEKQQQKKTNTDINKSGGFGATAMRLGPLGATLPIPAKLTPGKPHRVLGGTKEYTTAGWVFSRDEVFVRPKLHALLQSLASEARVKRFKGVLRVGTEWVMPLVDTAKGGDNEVSLEPIAYRRDSRLEVIVMAAGEGDGEGEGEEGVVKTGGGEEEDDKATVAGVECAGRAAAACDWDALEAAIKAAIKPPKKGC